MFKEIVSKDNSKLRDLIKLQKDKKFRDEQNLFVAEGIRFVQSVPTNLIKEIYLTGEALEKYPEIKSTAEKVRFSYIISGTAAKKIAETKNSQQIFAVCHMPYVSDFLPEKDGKYIILHNLQDPGNIGTIIRTAHAFGINGVLLSKDCPDVFSPKVLRSTMGSVVCVSVWQKNDTVKLIELFKKNNIPVWGTALTNHSVSINDINFDLGGAVIIGNEGSGLPKNILDICDKNINIPISDSAESLNAAVAASVIMWEMKK